MKDLNSIRVFVRVAKLRSFKAAAASLGLTSSAISKAITRLESEVGVTLLQRTSRSVGLTEYGAAFFENCTHVLEEIERAEGLLSLGTSGVFGRLRIHMPEAFGRRVVMPLLKGFLDQYPKLTVSAELSERTVDLAHEGLDVNIQIGEVRDCRLVARRLGEVRFVTCASPGYLSVHGEPSHPKDLERHNCVVYSHMHTGRVREWRFLQDGAVYSQPVAGNLQANNAEGLLAAAIAGLGIVNVSHFIAREAIEAGKVKAILGDHHSPGPMVHAVYLPSHNVAPKVRALVDYLARNAMSNG